MVRDEGSEAIMEAILSYSYGWRAVSVGSILATPALY